MGAVLMRNCLKLANTNKERRNPSSRRKLSTLKMNKDLFLNEH